MSAPTRHYLPTTRDQLATWYDAGQVPPTDLFFVPPEDTDLGEYSALMDAADHSSTLAGGDGRRMVLVVETAGDATHEPMVWRLVVALHVDVAAGARPDDELAWYATQEIGPLLGR